MKTTRDSRESRLIHNPHDLEQIETAQKAKKYSITNKINERSSKDYLNIIFKMQNKFLVKSLKLLVLLFCLYFIICFLWYKNGNYVETMNAVSYDILSYMNVHLKYRDGWNFQYLLSMVLSVFFSLYMIFDWFSRKELLMMMKLVRIKWYHTIGFYIQKIACVLFGLLCFICVSPRVTRIKIEGSFSKCTSFYDLCNFNTTDMFYTATIHTYIHTVAMVWYIFVIIILKHKKKSFVAIDNISNIP
ncbi:MAG: hypothetical protein Q4B71_06235 [Cardiobacteriaceae bacterium]|nr:hypothetical protein [Cardiobacteriaceae bacterium]